MTFTFNISHTSLSLCCTYCASLYSSETLCSATLLLRAPSSSHLYPWSFSLDISLSPYSLFSFGLFACLFVERDRVSLWNSLCRWDWPPLCWASWVLWLKTCTTTAYFLFLSQATSSSSSSLGHHRIHKWDIQLPQYQVIISELSNKNYLNYGSVFWEIPRNNLTQEPAINFWVYT